MATIKELFTEHGVENTELQAKIEGLLTTAESKKTDGIPYSRFKEKVDQAQEYKADNAELQSKFDKLEKTLLKQKEDLGELKGFKEKYETFQTNELKLTTEKFNKIVSGLTVEETDPKYATYKKVLDKLTLAGKDETLTYEQINANLAIYGYAEEFGALKLSKEDFDNGANPNGGANVSEDDPLDAFSK